MSRGIPPMTFQGDGCPPVGPSRRQRARRKAVAIVVPTGVALGAGAMIANAAIPASDGTIGACYAAQGGAVRFVDSAADCRGAGQESRRDLHQVQPDRPGGPAGATGATGAAGAPAPRRTGRARRHRLAGTCPGSRVGLPARDRRHQGRVRRQEPQGHDPHRVVQLGRLPDRRPQLRRWRRCGQGVLPGPPLHRTRQQGVPAAVQALRAPASTSRRRRCTSARPAASSRTTT